jgi:hypothetical protein
METKVRSRVARPGLDIRDRGVEMTARAQKIFRHGLMSVGMSAALQPGAFTDRIVHFARENIYHPALSVRSQ